MVDSTCEKCQTAGGEVHSFHYGRKAGLPSTDPPPTYRMVVVGNVHSAWTEHYEVGGMEGVALCNRCLMRARMRRAATTLMQQWFTEPLIALLYLLWGVGVVVWVIAGDWAQLAIWLGVGAGVTLAAYSAMYLMLRGEEFAQQIAVELHEEKLRSEGWDTFWTDPAYRVLTPH